MGVDWFIRPDTTRLALSEGQWILVKKRLNTGEQREYLRRGQRLHADGTLRLDDLDLGLSLLLAYLVDWSLPDVPIRGLGRDDLAAVLDNLDPARFLEIKKALEAHDAAITAERVASKNGQGTETGSPAISPSPSAVTGAMNGLPS